MKKNIMLLKIYLGNTEGKQERKMFLCLLLNGWNAAENRIVHGGMDSTGSMSLGTITADKAAKTITLAGEGVDGDGKEFAFKNVVTKTGKDTLTWQALERTGGDVEGPSPVYKFERVKRTGKAKKPTAK